MRHDPLSQGEGLPTRLRVITPDTLALTTPVSKASNYTDCASCSLNVTDDGNFNSSSFDFEFNRGILYSDVVSLNFSLTVDPHGRGRPGAKTAAVVLQPICNVSQHEDSDGILYPADVT